MRTDEARKGHPGNIFLLGFSGCGKSTIGPLLAERLQRRFVDSDAEIERRAGRPVGAIFEDRGEAAFRKLETEVLRELTAESCDMVVALGGGAVTVPCNRRMINRSGVSIYLSCSVRELERRLRGTTDRPLLAISNRQACSSLRRIRQERIAYLLSKRRHLYRASDFTVATTNRSPRETVDEIIVKLRRKDADH
jgi:shikimate kinase